MSEQQQQPQKRTNINLSGILKHAKVFTTQNGKQMVSLILSENVAGKDQTPEYVSYKLTAVGEAASKLNAAISNGQLPFGRDNDQFTIIHTENCRPRAQDVKASNRTYENGVETVADESFNASVLSFTAFNVDINVLGRNQPQPQPQPQQPQAQQPQAQQPQAQQPQAQQPQAQAQQPQPQQQDFSNFDDDIPF